MGQCTSNPQHPRNKVRSDATQGPYKIEDFKLLKLVGKGGFSHVWKALQKRSGKIYALKVMSKAKIIAKKSVRAVLLERIILSKLMEGVNDGVVSMLASFQDENNLYILMDYLQGQSLRSHLNSGISPSHNQIRSLIYALLQTLQTLYWQRVVHRDIKPQNILFNKNGQPFITDFGIASYNDYEISDINSGTVGYMAPQVMLSQSHSFTVDYFAIGVITFQLFFKKRPYNFINKDDMVRQIVKNPVNVNSFPQLKDIPTEASDFIVKLLQRKARIRLGFEHGITDLLEHPWFSSMESDSSDRIQLNNIKFPLSETQCNVSIENTLQSANTQMNQEKISKILHREHIQEMFKDFNSQTTIETIKTKRRMSQNVQTFSTPVSLKRIATAFT